jgi:cytochrome c-type biogenesis protein CcmE
MKKNIITGILLITVTYMLVTNFNRKLELITTYDKIELEKRYGGDAIGVAGDWCMGDVQKIKKSNFVFPDYNVKTSINQDKINCYFIANIGVSYKYN